MEVSISNSLISNALELAIEIHEGQKRKETNIPYIVHPVEVALILQANGANEEMIAAGLLHDTLEDGKEDVEKTKERIESKLNSAVLDLVLGASEKLENRSDTPWEVRKQHTIDYLKDPDTELPVKLVSCADKLSNARSMYRDYKNEKENLWTRFNAGYECQKKYYNGLVDSLKDLNEYSMYKEFKKIVEVLFEK